MLDKFMGKRYKKIFVYFYTIYTLMNTKDSFRVKYFVIDI